MTRVKKLILDVLKPHLPNILQFSGMIADKASCQVHSTVLEVDDKTQTIKVVVEGDDIDFAAIETVITELGGSLHSIDEVITDSRETPAQ